MQKQVTLYNDASNGGKKQWSIEMSDDGLTISYTWGLVGKKLQTKSDAPRARGKEGTAAWKSPAVVAGEEYERLLKKKRDEGYTEDVAKARQVTQNESRDFNRLDKQFVASKPINDMTTEELSKMHADGKVMIQRKRDGQRHHILVTPDRDVRIYSRRMEDLTANFPRLRNAFLDLNLKPGAVLDGEIIIDRDGNDDFKAVNSITKALPVKAAQREKELPVKFVLFDVLFLDGEEAWRLPYRSRFDLIEKIVRLPDNGKMIIAPEVKRGSIESCMETVKNKRWEGLVLWFLDQPTIVRNGGQPKRTGCAKLKPLEEDDFIATSYELGTGSMSDIVGALFIEQIGPDGKIRKCGKVGSGFDLKDRKEALGWTYPAVVQLEYDKQEPDTFNLRFPVFVRKRDDKAPAECIGRELTD